MIRTQPTFLLGDDFSRLRVNLLFQLRATEFNIYCKSAPRYHQMAHVLVKHILLPINKATGIGFLTNTTLPLQDVMMTYNDYTSTASHLSSGVRLFSWPPLVFCGGEYFWGNWVEIQFPF